MKSVPLGKSSLVSSRLAFGCWRIAGTWDPTAVTADAMDRGRQAILAAYDAGYTLFDHADVYCDGVGESIFGQVLKKVPGMRSRVVIATKCGIRKPGDPNSSAPFRYDFSADHIIRSCEHSLKRLGVDTIDLYQLHRPDYLMDPEEVATAFVRLKEGGKVREFGVSNFKPTQLHALQKACPMPMIVNQVEISLAQRDCFDDGTLEQCLAHKITPLAWSPLAGGLLADGAKSLLPSQGSYQVRQIVNELDAIAKERSVRRTTIALAWLLKHPAKIIPIVGSTQSGNIKDAARADALELTREEWYRLLEAARGQRVP